MPEKSGVPFRADAVMLAKAVLASWSRDVQEGHWVPAHYMHHSERHCVHCSYRECLWGCFYFLKKPVHDDSCPVVQARRIVDEAKQKAASRNAGV